MSVCVCVCYRIITQVCLFSDLFLAVKHDQILQHPHCELTYDLIFTTALEHTASINLPCQVRLQDDSLKVNPT